MLRCSLSQVEPRVLRLQNMIKLFSLDTIRCFSSSAYDCLPGIKTDIIADLDLLTTWRHDFHMHPEIGYEEYRTAKLVSDRLRSFGVDHVETGIAKTGVVGTIIGKGMSSGQSNTITSIGLRADMDCLPMTEENDVPHQSTVNGLFHGCGHDGHTTMLLAAAKYLASTRNFSGSVQLIFQPAEEGGGGGKLMIDEGLFDRFSCDEVYGLHNWPILPFGQFGIRPGPLMASADRLYITIMGKGGHAAMPHTCVDPILIASQVITALQSLTSRTVDPLDSAVISITQFRAGSAHNVIPDTAILEGTVRAFLEKTRDRLQIDLRQIVQSIALAMGGSADIDYIRGYPPTVNHPKQTKWAAEAASAVVGSKNIIHDVTPTMGAEDFSYMLQKKPGCFVFLGQSGGPSSSNIHNPTYDFNDAVIPLGASWLVKIVESRMPL